MAKLEAKKWEYRLDNGVELDIVMSALQKCVRLGREKEAVYWGRAIHEQYPILVWKRLATIASEDIGLGDPQASALIHSMCASYMALRNADKMFKSNVIVTHAIMVACRAKKNRDTDHLNIVTSHHLKDHKPTPEIDDAFLDKHTKQGKMKKRGFKHFLDEGCRLTNQSGPHEYEAECRKVLLGAEKDLFEEGVVHHG